MSISKKGQSSVEYAVLTAISIVIFLIALLVINNQFQIMTSQRIVDDTNLALKQIANAATEVYQQGSGAQKVISVTFPQAVDEGSLLIINNTLVTTVKGTTLIYKVDFPFSGTLPTNKTFDLLVTSQGGAVVAGPLPFTVSPIILTYDVCSQTFDQSRSQILVFTNNQEFETPVTLSSSWSNGSVNLSATPSAFTLPFQGSQNVSVDIKILASTGGFYEGSVIANTSTGAVYSVTIPVTVDITSCGPGVVNVSRIAVTTFRNSNYNVTKTAFGPVENVTITGGDWIYSSVVTLDIRYSNGTSVSGYPTITMANATGDIQYIFNPSGLASGNYSVIANQSATVRTTYVILRGCT
jgi:uncharacterized protein (UPF0333 family)